MSERGRGEFDLECERCGRVGESLMLVLLLQLILEVPFS